MKATISEFSFGFAVTHELCQELSNLGFSAAPLFPNLKQEGSSGYGYDVKISLGFPLFLQFKLSDMMIRRRKPDEWNFYTKSYFRVHLHKRSHSNQHQLLQELANKGHYVCYASPIFLKPPELDQAFLSRQVVRRSMFINVNRLPQLPDNKSHYYTFLKGDDLKFWSKPLAIEGKFTGEIFLKNVIENLENREALSKIDLEYFYKLRTSLLETIGTRNLPLNFNKNQDIDEDPITDIVFLCRAYLGCEVLFVGLSKREKKPKERILRLS